MKKEFFKLHNYTSVVTFRQLYYYLGKNYKKFCKVQNYF